jgi:hypothetical protein
VGNFLSSRGTIGFSRRTLLHGVSHFVSTFYFSFLLSLLPWSDNKNVHILTLTQAPSAQYIPFRLQCLPQRLSCSVTTFLLWDSSHGLSTCSPWTCPPQREKRMLTNLQRISLHQKLTAAQIANTFQAFYGTRAFPSQMNPVHTIVCHLRPILILFSHLCLGFPSVLLPTGFRTKALYTLRSAPKHAIARLITSCMIWSS